MSRKIEVDSNYIGMFDTLEMLKGKSREEQIKGIAKYWQDIAHDFYLNIFCDYVNISRIIENISSQDIKECRDKNYSEYLDHTYTPLNKLDTKNPPKGGTAIK